MSCASCYGFVSLAALFAAPDRFEPSLLGVDRRSPGQAHGACHLPQTGMGSISL